MSTENARVGVDRRTLMRGALAAAAAVPTGGILAACAAGGGGTSNETPKGKVTANNPFGMADKSAVDAVIFNGGYGIDYAQFAAKIVEQNHSGSTVKVSPSTQISQELQPRFVAGDPPDLVDNSGANQIGLNTIRDQLETLDDVIAANNLEGTKISDTLFPGVTAPGTFDGKFVALNYAMTVYALWYSASLFQENGWTPPKTWAEALDLGAKAKAKGKYLFVWGKEAATYYQTACLDSAIKQGGHEVRLALDNLKPNCWSHPAIQAAFNGLGDIIKAGYMKPGGSGTQFTAAQAQWSNNQDALLYPSGGWIANEMKSQTKSGFMMTGVPMLTIDSNSTFPYMALHSNAGEPYIVPSKAKNVAGGKELLRVMLSKEAATNFAKTKLASTIVKGTVPADGFGSTALQSQTKMLTDAGSNIFTWNFVSVYGVNKDMLVVWNSFLKGDIDVAGLTKALQTITDKVYNDASVKKVSVR